MDPNACLKRIADAAGAGDVEETTDAATDLAVWLHRGGFAPEATHGYRAPCGSAFIPRWMGAGYGSATSRRTGTEGGEAPSFTGFSTSPW